MTRRKNKYQIRINQGRNRLDMNITINNNIIQYNEYKVNKAVKKAVENKGLSIWKQGIERKQSLVYYRNKEKPGYEYGYDGSWEAKLIFKTRTGSLETRHRTRRWNNNEWWCEACLEQGVRIREDIEHLIVGCASYTQERLILENVLINEIGEIEWELRKQEEDLGIATVLGFKEKSPIIIKEVKKYLNKIWKKRNYRHRLDMPIEEHNYYR